MTKSTDFGYIGVSYLRPQRARCGRLPAQRFQRFGDDMLGVQSSLVILLGLCVVQLKGWAI